jgi:adenylate kinase
MDILHRNLVFLGAPGAGKGTLAALLAAQAGLPHISTGDIFRNEIKNGTALGQQAQAYVSSGGLVPDSLVADMVGSRLAQPDCAHGFILDGFPRTLPQADLLTAALARVGKNLDRVVLFDATEELLIQRLTARLVCRSCGATFNKLFSPPQQAGKCDPCGGELYQRDDDSLATAQGRLRVFAEQTAPLIPYYEQRGLLVRINGGADKADAFRELQQVLA